MPRPWELSQQLQILGTASEVPLERCPELKNLGALTTTPALGHRSGGTSGAVPRPWELSHSHNNSSPWELSQQLQPLGTARRYLRSGAQTMGATSGAVPRSWELSHSHNNSSPWAPLRSTSGAVPRPWEQVQTLGALATTPALGHRSGVMRDERWLLGSESCFFSELLIGSQS